MSENKFRAVLTIFNTNKILEVRFDGLNDNKTRVTVKPNLDNRHRVNEREFINAFMNLNEAISHYTKQTMNMYLLTKMLGMI